MAGSRAPAPTELLRLLELAVHGYAGERLGLLLHGGGRELARRHSGQGGEPHAPDGVLQDLLELHGLLVVSKVAPSLG